MTSKSRFSWLCLSHSSWEYHSRSFTVVFRSVDPRGSRSGAAAAVFVIVRPSAGGDRCRDLVQLQIQQKRCRPYPLAVQSHACFLLFPGLYDTVVKEGFELAPRPWPVIASEYSSRVLGCFEGRGPRGVWRHRQWRCGEKQDLGRMLGEEDEEVNEVTRRLELLRIVYQAALECVKNGDGPCTAGGQRDARMVALRHPCPMKDPAAFRLLH